MLINFLFMLQQKFKKQIIAPLAILISLSGFLQSANALQLHKRLYINNGTFTTVDTLQFPYYSFNGSKNYSPTNEVINMRSNDTLVITVINNDTSVHGFMVQGYSMASIQLNPKDSFQKKLTFSKEGVYIFYDDFQYPLNRYMGLGGMICVNNHKNTKNFYWNLKEHQKTYNKDIANNLNVDWSTYYPDYFTINGKSYPDLQNDTTARVLANVGDTVYIFIANSGQSKHSIHFHGFHSRVLFSSANYIQDNTIKETYPLNSMQCVLLEMIPDKVGLYSVHDHNLVAVSGGGKHPSGMFIIMKIQ